jgi:uncharacterized membrane protein
MSEKKFKSKNIEAMEITISNFLRLGVTTSAVVILIGLISLIYTGNSGYPRETFPTSVTAIIQGLILWKPYAIILSGLLLLVFTPVFRVAVSIITFLREKDYLYVVITSIVLIILIIGFLIGKIV